MANAISIFRIAASIVLLFCPVFSPAFYACYIMAGLSDMLDGFVARKTNTASRFGANVCGYMSDQTASGPEYSCMAVWLDWNHCPHKGCKYHFRICSAEEVRGRSFGYEQSDRSAAVSINTDDSRSPAEVFCDCRLCFSNGRRNSGRPSDQDRGTQWKRRISDMNEYIAYCGLDCEACEARLATVNNDDALRRRVAKEWSELNSAEITPEMINCSGCRIPGVKTPYCDFLCPIRQCAIGKQMETCGRCPEMNSCEKLSMITGNNADALRRLMEV